MVDPADDLGAAIKRDYLEEEAELAKESKGIYAGYLPMDCPACGRRRLETWIQVDADERHFAFYVHCEKCRWNSEDADLWNSTDAD